MAVVFIDGFDSYATSTDMGTDRWLVTTAPGSFVTGRFGGQAVSLQRGSAGGGDITALLPSALSALTVGVAFETTEMLTARSVMIFKNNTTTILTLFKTATNTLQLVRGATVNTNILAETSAFLVSGIWYYVEIELVRNASTGSVNFYINGSLNGSGSSLNTGASDIDRVNLAVANSGVNVWYDDLYVLDVATRLGEHRVETLRPTSDTAQIDFTPSTGTNHAALVDETVYNGDTDYNASGTVGHKDRYNMGDLSSTPPTISAVQVNIFAKKDDATTRQIRSNLKSGATTANGATKTVLSTYQATADIYALDPNGSIAWTAAAVNALEAGVEVVT
jgi:hypothetical protein